MRLYHAIVWGIDNYKLNSYTFDFILILVTINGFDYHDNLFQSEKFEIHQNNKFETEKFRLYGKKKSEDITHYNIT